MCAKILEDDSSNEDEAAEEGEDGAKEEREDGAEEDGEGRADGKDAKSRVSKQSAYRPGIGR